MRIALFSELNSKFGEGILNIFASSVDVDDLILVTRADHVLCSYYVTEPDSPNLKKGAIERGCEVIQTENLNDLEFRNKIAQFKADYLIIANYQKKIDQGICATAKYAALNFHPSPLPRYAGLAPFFWMARRGETQGGVSCCHVSDMIDGGDIIDQELLTLSGHETCLEIRNRHFEVSFRQAQKLLPKLVANDLPRLTQDASKRKYYGKPDLGNMTINWDRGTEDVLRTVRASSPYPGALAILPNGVRIRITSAEAFPLGYLRPPGQLRQVDGYWFVSTSNGWIRLNMIGCYGASEDIPCFEELRLTIDANQNPQLLPHDEQSDDLINLILFTSGLRHSDSKGLTA